MKRYRRLRRSKTLRKSLREINIGHDELILPVFTVERENWSKEISSMPNIYQYSPDLAMMHVQEMVDLGIKNYMLFGIPQQKDFEGKAASDPNGPVAKTLSLIKENFGDEVMLYADVCLCEYTTHGHCGIPNEMGQIQNDVSLSYLSDAALTYAKAGADYVAPSNMMDNRVRSIRQKLDEEGFKQTGILSYSAKFASNYYGPFRDAAESPPQFGDRRSYQIDFQSPSQAWLEVETDIRQGADAVMVKPALPYLDIIKTIAERIEIPLFAYNVSGEYSMIKFGAKSGLFSEQEIVLENLLAIKRAGADVILTYHAVDIAQNRWLE